MASEVGTTELEITCVQDASEIRKAAMRNEADPVFFKAQRGEATMQNWLDKVQEIRDRYPNPVVPVAAQ